MLNTMTIPEQFPFIDVAGAPYERGKNYGMQASRRIHRSAEIYGQALVTLGYGSDARRQLIHGFVREIENFAPHYLDEMRGIADGAGVDIEDVVMINARTEVVAKAHAEKHEMADSIGEDGCTAALIMKERSSTGNLIHGQNWDWRAECAETTVVLRIRSENGPDILTFVEAGGLSRSGFNGAGISITGNYLESDRDFTQLGVPLSLIRRKVLEQEHMALAIRTVTETSKSCSNNIMIGSREGFGIDFECTTNEAFPIYVGPDGLIVHANHWTSPVALTKLVDTGRPNSPDSLYRDYRVRTLLSEKQKLGRDDLKQAFFDDFATPYSVCRPPRPGRQGTLSATVGMVVMEPELGFMDVAPLPALNRTFTRYSLTDDPILQVPLG
jgi:hypothetical protein